MASPYLSLPGMAMMGQGGKVVGKGRATFNELGLTEGVQFKLKSSSGICCMLTLEGSFKF